MTRKKNQKLKFILVKLLTQFFKNYIQLKHLEKLNLKITLTKKAKKTYMSFHLFVMPLKYYIKWQNIATIINYTFKEKAHYSQAKSHFIY